MQKLLSILLALAAVTPLALAGHAGPDPCPPADRLSLGVWEVGTGASVFYLDDNEAGDVVLYEESNGIYVPGDSVDANLQRSAGLALLPSDPEVCPVEHDLLPPDLKHADSGWV